MVIVYNSRVFVKKEQKPDNLEGTRSGPEIPF